jgi:predicted CXXCH cytochrome family protein
MDTGVNRRTGSPTFLALLILGLSAQAQASDLGLTEANCRCCHGPTMADRHHLLTVSRGFECLLCHQLTWDPVAQQYAPAVVRDCLQCHTGSLADRHHLLLNQVDYNCFSCHTIDWDPVTETYGPVFSADCVTSPKDPYATINGTVRDASGVGLPWVEVTTDKGGYSALTTAAGSFQLASIAPGSYVISASANGYAPASLPVTVASGRTASVDFVLSPVAVSTAIGGLVVDRTQTPVEGATVSSNDGLHSTLTAADGSFALTNLAAGSYVLTAQKSGYGSETQTIQVAAGQVATTRFLLPDLPVEICGDNLDNDNNGLVDCADPACSSTAACLPPVEICDDGIDNDENGLADCSDPACMGTAPNCPPPVVEVCGDGIDNDGNGLADCADPACSALASCLPEDCTDEVDNNGDGLVDCADPVCAGTSKCLPPPVEICDDGLDNDSNGQVDCADAKCASSTACAPPDGGVPPPSASCEYIVRGEWGTGFIASIRIRNNGTAPINGWEVSWGYHDNIVIERKWNAKLSGSNPYSARAMNWNAVIYPGRKVQFGMIGKRITPPAQVPELTGALCAPGSGVRCEYVVEEDLNAGFAAIIRISNDRATSVNGWEVSWQYTDGSVIVAHLNAALSGSNPYTAKNRIWNKVIRPGQSVTFGLVGRKAPAPAEVPVVSGAVCGN